MILFYISSLKESLKEFYSFFMYAWNLLVLNTSDYFYSRWTKIYYKNFEVDKAFPFIVSQMDINKLLILLDFHCIVMLSM